MGEVIKKEVKKAKIKPGKEVGEENQKQKVKVKPYESPASFPHRLKSKSMINNLQNFWRYSRNCILIFH